MKRIGAASLALAVTVVLAEGLVRVVNPTPRAQVVRPATSLQSVEVVDGVPLWRAGIDDAALRNEGCPGPGTFDVALAWDSIGYDTGRSGADTVVSAHLARLLADAPRPVCVLNLSQPAYRADQQLTEARLAHARHGLDLVVVGAWKTPEHYTLLGDAWVITSDRERDALGTPRLPGFPFPGPHRWLVAHSRLWAYTTLALAPRARPDPQEPGWGAFPRWAEASGVDLLFVHPTPLDRPLAETAAARAAALQTPEGSEARRLTQVSMLDPVRSAGVPVLDAAALLAGEDLDAIRLDRCCHLSPHGHAALARALAPHVRARMPPAPP